MVYNADERVQVSTTPLYCLLLAGTRRVTGCEVPAASRFWEFLFLAANVLLLWWLVVRLGYGDWAWLVPLVFVADPAIVSLATGMESAAFMAFILATLWALGSDRPIWTAVLLAAAVLTRLDGLILALLVGLIRLGSLVRGREDPKRWLVTSATQAGVFAVLVLPWFLFAWGYFGNPLPVTIAHKMAQPEAMGLPLFWKFFAENFAWDSKTGQVRALFLPFVIGAIVLGRERRTTFWLVEWCGLYLVVYTLAGMPAYLWYQFPLYVPAAAVSVIGLASIGRWAFRRPGSGAFLAGTIALAIIAACFVFQVWEPWRYLPRCAAAAPDSPLRDCKRYGAVGRYLAEEAPPDAVVAAFEVGLIGYYSKRQILDLTGLIAPLSDAERRLNSLALVLARRPDYLVMEEDIYDNQPQADRLRFEKTYERQRVFTDPYFGEKEPTGKTVIVFFLRDSADGSTQNQQAEGNRPTASPNGAGRKTP